MGGIALSKLHDSFYNSEFIHLTISDYEEEIGTTHLLEQGLNIVTLKEPARTAYPDKGSHQQQPPTRLTNIWKRLFKPIGPEYKA